MRKIFKIIIAVFAVLVILVAAFGALIFLDLAAYTATGSQTLTPTGTSLGRALVVYDPGLSGTAKTVADQIASDLQAKGYTVIEAGVKSSTAANTTDFAVIVAGGPVYAGALTGSVKDFLNSLPPGHGATQNSVGVFGSGQGPTSQSDIDQIKASVPALSDSGALSGAVVVKIGQTEDLAARASDFVNQLVQ
jgi:flavodoxin